jgi:cytochrome c553
MDFLGILEMKKLTFAVCVLMSGMVFADGTSPDTGMKADAAAGKAKAGACMACHGADGNSPSDAFPKIAGQGAKFLEKQLHAFKSGSRKNALMESQVAELSDQDIANIAAHYSGQTMSQNEAKNEALARGKTLFLGGDTGKNLPACMACHGPNGAGNAAAGFPRIGGQHATYIAAQLVNFAKGGNSQDAAREMMEDIAVRMSADDIAAVSNYASGLK